MTEAKALDVRSVKFVSAKLNINIKESIRELSFIIRLTIDNS